MKKLKTFMFLSIAFLACAITGFGYADSHMTQQGLKNGYRSSGMFYITSGSNVTHIVVHGKKDVTTQACNDPEVITTCKTDMDIRKQLADLIAQAEYSCVDTQEIVRLSTLLNNTKQEIISNCKQITNTIETETIVPALKQIIKIKGKTITIYVPMLAPTGSSI